MADIQMDFPIKRPARQVFEGFSTPSGLDEWWTRSSTGKADLGEEWELDFGNGYQWRARVTRCEPDAAFELELTDAHEDWQGTRVGVELEDRGERTMVRFHHTGWPEANDHWRTSCYCWAAYLRILRVYLERGERVPYGERLDA